MVKNRKSSASGLHVLPMCVARDPRLPRLLPMLGALLSLFAGGQLGAQTHVGQYEQADIAYGSSLYGTHCVVCHGVEGDTFPGVNLRSGRFRYASSDRDLRELIRDGIPGTAMIPGMQRMGSRSGKQPSRTQAPVMR